MTHSLAIAFTGLFLSNAAQATGFIENPQPGSFQSGIGVVFPNAGEVAGLVGKVSVAAK